jgi:hypothetical protein
MLGSSSSACSQLENVARETDLQLLAADTEAQSLHQNAQRSCNGNANRAATALGGRVCASGRN